MSLHTFKVHFIHKAAKTNKKGTAPIFARIRLNGIKIEISTNRLIEADNWLSDSQSAYPLNQSNKALNQYLESFRNKIYNAYTSLLSTGDEINREILIQAIYGKPVKKKYGFIESVEQHNQQFKKQIGIKYSEGSYKNYRTTLKYLRDFVPLHTKQKDIPLEMVDYKFCEAYYSYLTTEKTCTNNGASKQIQRIKKILNYSIMLGHLDTNPAASFALRFNPVHKVALTLEEIEKISSAKLQRETLSTVRDMFLFQCYTGLAYCDIKSLDRRNLQKDGNGKVWIKMKRQKTDVSFAVPLLPAALAILNKYFENELIEILPVLSNQKMNDNLKIIQEISGISKNLTTHLARHSFATIALNNDIPIETVSKMLGHTNIRTTQLYAKVLESKIERDMFKLQDIFK